MIAQQFPPPPFALQPVPRRAPRRVRTRIVWLACVLTGITLSLTIPAVSDPVSGAVHCRDGIWSVERESSRSVSRSGRHSSGRSIQWTGTCVRDAGTPDERITTVSNDAMFASMAGGGAAAGAAVGLVLWALVAGVVALIRRSEAPAESAMPGGVRGMA